MGKKENGIPVKTETTGMLKIIIIIRTAAAVVTTVNAQPWLELMGSSQQKKIWLTVI